MLAGWCTIIVAVTVALLSFQMIRRGSWIPNGAVRYCIMIAINFGSYCIFMYRPPSSFTDSVKDNYDNSDRLADDLTSALSSKDLMDTTFLVGKELHVMCMRSSQPLVTFIKDSLQSCKLTIKKNFFF